MTILERLAELRERNVLPRSAAYRAWQKECVEFLFSAQIEAALKELENFREREERWN